MVKWGASLEECVTIAACLPENPQPGNLTGMNLGVSWAGNR